jgi:2-polyprenyl-3-methyl-5-hydroxy-6-metoxy-1,4-benzoquinol methylase
MRDYNSEAHDSTLRYAYDFDWVLRRYIMRAFEPFFRPGRALELGCYQGQMTELIAERYRDLDVVEASDELIANASQRLGTRARFIHGTFEQVEVRERYDAVFLVHTLEHLDDPVLVLRRIRDWLTPAGRLFVAVPNANAASRQIAVAMGLIPHNSAVTDSERLHGHRITYSLDTLQRDVRQGGLRVVHAGGVFFKALANYQFDQLLGGDVISDGYLDGCFELGLRYPDLCASVFTVCDRDDAGGATT